MTGLLCEQPAIIGRGPYRPGSEPGLGHNACLSPVRL
jgi:hypothetical protein